MQNQNIKGYLYAFSTIIIWTGWMIISRMGTNHHLTPFDITFFRYIPAGILLAPAAYKNRKLITRKNYKMILLMILGAGPLYLMATSSGFKLAPAAHGVLTPCSMTLFVAILTYLFLRERITKIRLTGYLLILTGVIYKFSISGGSWADCYFLLGGFLFAIYTIQNKNAKLPPLAVTAFVVTGSTILLIIPYAIYTYIYPHPMALESIAGQIIYQGIITAIISFVTYNRAIQLIGAARASCFAALIPMMIIVLSIPFLNELPDRTDLIFAAFMSAGVFLASGVVRSKTK